MSRKGENIYKRKDGRWEGRYIKSRTDKGKIVYGYVYAKTYREVKLKLQENILKHNLQTAISVDSKSDLFLVIAFDWFETMKLQIKESTINKYHNILTNYILPTYKDKTLNDINYDFIEAHCNFLLSSGGKKSCGLSPKTVTDVLSVIRSILKFAIKKGMYVPCDGTSVQIKTKTKTMRILSKSEQEKLCKYILSEPEPCNIGILICMFTGLRIGEICALRWEDISFSDQIIHVHSTIQRIQNLSSDKSKTKIIITTPKSSCSVRNIPITDQLKEILVKYKKSSYGYILTNDEHKFIEPRTMQYRFKRILKLNDIENANFHSIRHTFATRCIELGFDVKSLSEILGHATVNITMNRYVHPSIELKKENMKKLSVLLAVK